MAKPKKSYVLNVVTVKILSLAWHTSVPRSTTQLLPLRIHTVTLFPGQAPAVLDLEVPVSRLHSQLKWQQKLQLKQQWNTA